MSYMKNFMIEDDCTGMCQSGREEVFEDVLIGRLQELEHIKDTSIFNKNKFRKITKEQKKIESYLAGII